MLVVVRLDTWYRVLSTENQVVSCWEVDGRKKAEKAKKMMCKEEEETGFVAE